MRTVAGLRRRGTAGVAVLVMLTAAACGTGGGPSGSRATAPSGTASPSGTGTTSLTWEFEHIADFSGDLTDIAVLAADDVWAVADEHDSSAGARLLHYDGARWTREPLPEALGATDYPPLLDQVGADALWLRPHTSGGGPDGGHWAKWDGARWSAVAHPGPTGVRDIKSAGPDDVWALGDERTAQHWDGTRWTATRLPFPAADLAVVGLDDVWAVGRRTTGPGTVLNGTETYSQPASAHWDGTSWKAVDTPQAHFPEPVPAEPGAGLNRVLALDGGEVRAYGINGFNHGEAEDEPQDQYLRLRWDGSKWAEQEAAPGQCAERIPVGQEHGGLFLEGNWYLTDGGRCVKIGRHRLPASTDARKGSNQSLWLTGIHRVPGTDEWLGAGHVQVNQPGDPFDAPVVVRLKRGS
ncbi:hypothetical protein ACFV3R_12175 [Streptomyces sp. NPDC059740]|uniref:hypothetical protein n=1 Tax=Streptomyces sp. NPDC059740 TaxID=3346926 RepID=UPI0036542866